MNKLASMSYRFAKIGKVCLFLLATTLGAGISNATDYYWQGVDTNWANFNNWETLTFQQGIPTTGDRGFLTSPSLSAITVGLVGTTNVGGIVLGTPNVNFNMNGYTIFLENTGFTGPTQGNITINGSGNFDFVNGTSAAGNTITNYSTLNFKNTSTAATSVIVNHSNLSFQDNSSAGGGVNVITNDNTVTFSNSASAGSRTFANSAAGNTIIFQNNSTAASSQLINYTGAFLNFNDNSTAATAQLQNNAGTINFNSNSTASTSTITNNTGGALNFNSNSSAANANVTNYGAISFHDYTSADHSIIANHGSVIFDGNSTAANTTLTNSGTLVFDGNSSAGAIALTNNANLTFQGNASAGTSTVTNNSGGYVYFAGSSDASQATVNNNSGGVVDIENLTTSPGNSANVYIGSISGAGEYRLGSNNLITGGLNTSTTVSGNITGYYDSSSHSNISSLTKVGTGTLTLAGAVSAGTVYLQGGTTVLNGQTGSVNSNVTFQGSGGTTFRYDNSTGSASVGVLTFDRGEGTVIQNSSASSSLNFQQLARSPGATGNFVFTNGASTIALGGQATGFIDPAIFVNGNNYASYDATTSLTHPNGFLRPVYYGTDPNSVISSAGTTMNGGTITSATNVLLTGDVGAQTTTVINTVNLGTHNLYLASGGQTLSVNGILKTGGGNAFVGASDGIITNAYATNGGTSGDPDLIVRTDTAADQVTLEGAVNALAITKSGDGTLDLKQRYSGYLLVNGGSLTAEGGIGGAYDVSQSSNGTLTLGGTNNYTGATEVSAGTLKIAAGASVNGTSSVSVETGATLQVQGNLTSVSTPIVVNGTIGGSGTINGQVKVGSGGSSYPGDPQILSVNSIEYQSGSTAQFSIATTSSSPHPPVAGSDYDQIQLTAGTTNALQIDSGTTTLQLNLSATSLAALQANASNNLNDLYFVFNLGSGTSTGQFSDLTLTEGGNTYTDALIGGVATFNQLGLQINLSYTANQTNYTLTGGNDIAFSVEAIPEPGTWVLMIVGLGLLVAFRRRLTGKA